MDPILRLFEFVMFPAALCPLRCFSQMYFLSARLRDEENGHPEGPCMQHFKLHTWLRGKYDHFFQMEPGN